MKAQAPGKLILSGEHAVVYGCPALVMAVHHSAQATATRQPPDQEPRTIQIDAPQILGSGTMQICDLLAKRDELDARHAEFINGQRSIDRVITNYLDLAYYCVAIVLAHHPRPADVPPLHLQLSSDIPIGCGMGSSAAILAATLAVTTAAWQLPPLSRQTHYEWTLAAERLQHGRPSGVDPYIVTHGGCIRFQAGTATALNPRIAELHGIAPVPATAWLVLTGTPITSTGECVATVRERFGEGAPIWAQFAACTEAMQTALLCGDKDALLLCLRENHRLLCQIGVVPVPVQALVQDIESGGGAAKLCGAGATRGPSGGIALAMGLSNDQMQTLCDQHGYTCEPLLPSAVS